MSYIYQYTNGAPGVTAAQSPLINNFVEKFVYTNISYQSSGSSSYLGPITSHTNNGLVTYDGNNNFNLIVSGTYLVSILLHQANNLNGGGAGQSNTTSLRFTTSAFDSSQVFYPNSINGVSSGNGAIPTCSYYDAGGLAPFGISFNFYGKTENNGTSYPNAFGGSFYIVSPSPGGIPCSFPATVTNNYYPIYLNITLTFTLINTN